jgi:hypothetical protein
MERAQAIRYIVYSEGDDERYYGSYDEKYNTSRFLFGIAGGVPDPDGFDWVCEVSTTYAAATNWKFTPIDEWLKNEWQRIIEYTVSDISDEFYGNDREAWIALGFNPNEITGAPDANARNPS